MALCLVSPRTMRRSRCRPAPSGTAHREGEEEVTSVTARVPLPRKGSWRSRTVYTPAATRTVSPGWACSSAAWIVARGRAWVPGFVSTPVSASTQISTPVPTGGTSARVVTPTDILVPFSYDELDAPTGELDALASDYLKKRGAKAAFLGYNGYPASICASVNDEVVHGIPGDRKICEGDLVSVDIGAKYRGYFGDQAITYAVGEVAPEAARLMKPRVAIPMHYGAIVGSADDAKRFSEALHGTCQVVVLG